jgi:hypothetical protein
MNPIVTSLRGKGSRGADHRVGLDHDADEAGVRISIGGGGRHLPFWDHPSDKPDRRGTTSSSNSCGAA